MNKFKLYNRLLTLLMFFAVSQSLFAQSTKMSEALQPYIDRGEVPGIVSILATKDKILQIDCVGYANVEMKTPIAPDQLFWVASTSKFITGTALMMLVDDGKISLDDPIEKYLPEMVNLKVAIVRQDNLVVLQTPQNKPTVRHALSHQIGLPFITPMMDKYGVDNLPLQKNLLEISRTPLIAQPGTEFNYSELGIDIIGGIIEAVTGKPYSQFMQERLFDPLGMKDTTIWPSLEMQQNRWIDCYKTKDNKQILCNRPLIRTPYESETKRFPEPGACFFSTANDLIRFLQMHAGNGVFEGKRYLSEKAIEEMRTRQTPDNIDRAYGITCNLEGKWYGHGGACGNRGYVSNDGFARLYVVQVNGTGNSDAAAGVWTKISDEIFQAEKNKLP
ncbi:MAG: serine hydrolase domain-containing protein [Planctomycetia bacterium]|nr:serine hydrolase domain-containing protein [Planctomycetia bacterium]